MIKSLWWILPWEFSATVLLATIASTIWYLYRIKQLHPPLIHKILFWTGLISAYATLHTQFDYYSEHEFFMNRIQHSMLQHLAPFLIALSNPFPALRRRFFLNQPVIATLLFCGLTIFWLIPSIHFVAMLDWRIYRVMNWTMLLNGLMFWNLVLNVKSLRPTTCIMILLAVIPPQIAVGALIFFAPHELYPIYTICGRAFGISPLADQQIGGLILWIHGAMMSIIGILVVIKREWFANKIINAEHPI